MGFYLSVQENLNLGSSFLPHSPSLHLSLPSSLTVTSVLNYQRIFYSSKAVDLTLHRLDLRGTLAYPSDFVDEDHELWRVESEPELGLLIHFPCFILS